METFCLKIWMKKLRLLLLFIPLIPALSNTARSQGIVQDPVCWGEPIQLLCNFTSGCQNPGATYHWQNSSGSWTASVRDPVIYPPGSPIIGDGQAYNGYGLCNGVGYATDWISVAMYFAPPPGGFHGGSRHVMVNHPTINISGTVNDLNGNPLMGGNVYLFNISYGVLDTVTIATIDSGYFVFHNTCGADGSPVLVIPNAIGLQTMIPTYLGDKASWMDADTIMVTSSSYVGTIHMIAKPPPVVLGNAAIVKGKVYHHTSAKANDPIDNVGVIIRPSSTSVLYRYGMSDVAGFFSMGLVDPGEYSVYSEYPGIPMYTLNGANNIRSFNPYDTVKLTIQVVSDPVIVDSNFIRVYPSYVVLPACTVQSEDVHNGVTRCYDALQNLTVTGSGLLPVNIYSGGKAYFAAGQKIVFRPGFKVASGGSISGHITTTGQFCGQLLGPNLSPGGTTISDGNSPKSVEAGFEGNANTKTSGGSSFDQNSFFKVYPNPTSGSFTLELASEPGGSFVSVRCYNMMGELIMENAFSSGKKHELSLAGHAAGIYLLRVMLNGETGIKKIIKQLPVR